MKSLCLMLLFVLASAVGVQAQSQTPTPEVGGLTIERISWSRQVYNPMLEQDDPFKHNREQWEDARIQERIDRENAARAKSGKTAIYNRGRPVRIETEARGPFTTYTYKAKVTNHDTRTIRAVEWDYVFYDPATEKEVARHPLKNSLKLQPGKTTELSRRTARPPTDVVDVNKTDKKLKEQYAERVEIQRIEYTDGTSWQRPEK
ncbi:MAG TPA: hypothetical protein VGW12_07485 [Pyrinomonadaceae bacterium]|nr:hypothetical protein [Pyrinomonadaceae bacterium]